MRFSRKKKQHGDFGVVITSLLDINFLLIMFFLTTAHFQHESHSALNLPQEKGEEKAQPDEAGLVINVTANGSIIVSNKTIDLEELKRLAKAQVDRAKSETTSGEPAPLKLMIRADREASTADLNRVVFMLRDLGVNTIRIATEIPRT